MARLGRLLAGAKDSVQLAGTVAVGLGAVLYLLLTVLCVWVYSPLGVAPDEVGLGYVPMLLRTAVGWLALLVQVLGAAAAGAMAMAMIASVSPRLAWLAVVSLFAGVFAYPAVTTEDGRPVAEAEGWLVVEPLLIGLALGGVFYMLVVPRPELDAWSSEFRSSAAQILGRLAGVITSRVRSTRKEEPSEQPATERSGALTAPSDAADVPRPNGQQGAHTSDERGPESHDPGDGERSTTAAERQALDTEELWFGEGVAASGAESAAPLSSASGIDPAVAKRLKLLAVIFPLLFFLATVGLFWTASQNDRQRMSDGLAPRDLVPGFPPPWEADVARLAMVSELEDVQPPACVLYLGQAETVSVFYDARGRTSTLRIPNGEAVVTVLPTVQDSSPPTTIEKHPCR